MGDRAVGLHFNSYNGGGVASIQQHLEAHAGHINFYQETKCLKDKSEEKEGYLFASNLKSCWTPATIKNTKPSGGAAIVLPAWLDCWVTGACELWSGRVVFCFLRTKLLGTIVLYPVCLEPNSQLKGLNLQMLECLWRHAVAHGLPCLLAGDWNMLPAILFEFLPSGLRIVYDTQHVYGCSATANNTLDYFVVDHRLYRMISMIGTNVAWPATPRRPVYSKNG